MDKYHDQLTADVERLNVNQACDDVLTSQFELKTCNHPWTSILSLIRALCTLLCSALIISRILHL